MLKWKDIVERVDVLLLSDAKRKELRPFIDQNLLLCAIEIQNYVPSLTLDQKYFYTTNELADDGAANVCSLPEGIRKVKQVEIVDSAENEDRDDCNRILLERIPWDQRQLMICDTCKSFTSSYCFATDSDRTLMYIYPRITVDNPDADPPEIQKYDLVLTYDGMKRSYDPEEITPFPEESIQAFYYFVYAKILSGVYKNTAEALSYYNPVAGSRALFQRQLAIIYTTYK